MSSRGAYFSPLRVASGCASDPRLPATPQPEPPDRFWHEVVAFLRGHVDDRQLILAPAEFIHWFPGTIALHVRRRMLPEAPIAHYILHKGMLAWVDRAFLEEARRHVPTFANDVFVVFSKDGDPLPDEQRQHLAFFDHHVETLEPLNPPADSTGVVVITHNRPKALAPTLRGLARTKRPIIVVDDASSFAQRLVNRSLARRAGAVYLPLPRNRGLAHATNVGVCYWLAQPDITWISVFNDDVEVVDDIFDRLELVARSLAADGRGRLFAGHHSDLHLTHKVDEVDGQRILFGRSCSGIHLHAHRDYWQGVLPVPTTYEGAPKPAAGVFTGQGSETDWWIATWSPSSGVKRGADVVVVPGLVSHAPVKSTWSSSAPRD
jgi:hypothetical protein